MRVAGPAAATGASRRAGRRMPVGPSLAGALMSMVVACFAPPASADLMPPDTWKAWRRHIENDRVFDRADQYCRGKAKGVACVVPGLAFEGGGAGRCVTLVSPGPDGGTIDLRCLPSPPDLDRRLPAGPYRIDADLCETLTFDEALPDGGRVEIVAADRPSACVHPGAVADRYCEGRAPSAACTVDLVVDGEPQHAVGVCRPGIEILRAFPKDHRGRAQRPVLTCEPVNRPPEIVWTRTSFWKKLFQ